MASFSLNNVLISDEVDDKCIEILRNNGINVVKNTKLSKDELLQEISKYDGLVVRSATKVTKDVIEAGINLKLIGRAGTGVDNIDLPAATEKGIIVMNTPGGNTLSACELTCTMILSTSRHISNGTESLRAGRWDRKKFMGCEVYGKTLAIIGLGRIGQEVAFRMKSFGMEVIGYDPMVTKEMAAEFGVEWLTLDEIWPRADYITLHVPLINPTKNMINKDTIAKCKPGFVVINAARGGIIEENDLLEGLNSGQCGGAGLDVFLVEPPSNLDLVRHPKVTSTPHLGASTVEAQSRVAVEIAQQFVDFVHGKGLVGGVNAEAVSKSTDESSKPWINLARSLGLISASKLNEFKLNNTSVKLSTSGDELKKASSYLKAAFAIGLCHSKSGNNVNLVSAPQKVKNLGVDVTCVHDNSSVSGQSLLNVSIVQNGVELISLSGTAVFNRAILLSINKHVFPQNLDLQGNALIFCTKDDPSLITQIFSLLNENNVNFSSYYSSSVCNSKKWNVLNINTADLDVEKFKSLTEECFKISQ